MPQNARSFRPRSDIYAIALVITFLAVSGPLAGVLIGWFIRRQSERTSPQAATAQRHIDHICEIDRLVSSAMASLQTYEKRILVGRHLDQNGQASTKETRSDPGPARGIPSPPSVAPGRHRPQEPLDGQTLLDIKRDADRHIRECANALTRATAFLDDETVLRAQELVEALVATRETLETLEAKRDASSRQMPDHVASLHQSRIRFLETARERLHVEPLGEAIAERVGRLTEQTFSPSEVPRPYMATGVRLSEERL